MQAKNTLFLPVAIMTVSACMTPPLATIRSRIHLSNGTPCVNWPMLALVVEMSNWVSIARCWIGIILLIVFAKRVGWRGKIILTSFMGRYENSVRILAILLRYGLMAIGRTTPL